MNDEAVKQLITPIIQRGLDAWYWRGFMEGLIAGVAAVWVGYLLVQFAIGFYTGWRRSSARRQR